MSVQITKKYLNSIFLKKTWEDKDDSSNVLIGVGINKEEFIKELQEFPTNERGFINLTIGRQRANPDKFSMWLDERAKQVSKNTSQKKTTSLNSNGTTDDLPF